MRMLDRQQQAIIDRLRSGYEAHGGSTEAGAGGVDEASPAGTGAEGEGGDAGQDNEDDQDADLERLIGRNYERDEEDEEEEVCVSVLSVTLARRYCSVGIWWSRTPSL